MNFLEKIDRLMAERNINRHTLAAQSGIPYTTIIGFYTKGYEKAQLKTLKRLCEYFGVSLDYLVDEELPSSTTVRDENGSDKSDAKSSRSLQMFSGPAHDPDEEMLLTLYRSLNDAGRHSALAMLQGLSASPDTSSPPAQKES